jgi:hypothetical protein
MNINDLDPVKDKELMQELGIVFITDEIRGMKVNDMIVAMDHRPERIQVNDYTEDQATYKYRRKMIKNIEKHRKRGTAFWDSSKMGSYVNMSEDQIKKKYDAMMDGKSTEEVADQLMALDQEMRKQQVEKKYTHE